MKASMIQPYLFFGGRCEEALEFYQKTLGAKVDMLMRYDQSPQPMPPGSIPAGFEHKVMHATFQIGGSTLMASDGDDQELKFSSFFLSLTLPTEAEANRVFEALAISGLVVMPISKTFWSPCFGMLKDRFGLGWMITLAS